MVFPFAKTTLLNLFADSVEKYIFNPNIFLLLLELSDM